MKIANIDRPSFIAEVSSVSEFSSVEKVNQICDFLRTVLDKHAPPSLRKVITHNFSPWFESMREELFIAKRERRQAERKWRNTRLTISQVSSYLNSHNLYNTCQSAYRPCHSTETALLKVVYDLFLSLNKDNISVLALLDFSSAFDTIDHPIIVHRLHTDFGFTDAVLQWFSYYLTNRTHYISLSNHCSVFAPVHSGVPLGSVLRPILFTMYIKPLSAIIDSLSIIHHSFADDLQLQMSAPPDRISELLHSMQSCISDVKAWATANMLKLNDNKTELMLITSKRTKHLHSLPTSITIGNAQVPLKQSVNNLGFSLDCHLTMNAHVTNIARTCYFELRRLASIRRFLTSTATATLVSAFVLS